MVLALLVAGGPAYAQTEARAAPASGDPPAASDESAHGAPDESAHGARGASSDRPRSGGTALPVATYSPETELGVGAFAAYFFRFEAERTESRPSSVAAVALVTTREQAIFELIQELYWDDEHWRFWNKADYRHYPNAFWGVGNDTPESAREWYLASGPRIQSQLRRRIVDDFNIELRGDAQFLRNLDFEEGGLLASGRVSGAQSGRIVGIGPTLILDTRDHLLVPRSGGFYELSYLQFHRFLGGEYDFARMEANLRRFIPVGETHVLATQIYIEGSVGDTPFNRLALIGGQRLLRGYFEGRFRDRYMMAAQLEYRLPLFWRFGAVGFLAMGDVAPNLGSFRLADAKWSAGAGLRFRLNQAERLNLRTDIGFGLFDRWALYVGVAEAF